MLAGEISDVARSFEDAVLLAVGQALVDRVDER